MSNSAGLVELVSTSLAKEDIPHVCHAVLKTPDDDSVLVGIAISSEERPYVAIMCVDVDSYEELFLEEYGGEYDAVLPDLDPLTSFVARIVCGLCSRLKMNREKPLLCLVVIDSSKQRLRRAPLRSYMGKWFDGVFLKQDLNEIPPLVRRVLGDSSFGVITERLWTDEHGVKRISFKKTPIGLFRYNKGKEKRE